MGSSEQSTQPSNRNGWNEWSRYVLELLGKHAAHIETSVKEVARMAQELQSVRREISALDERIDSVARAVTHNAGEIADNKTVSAVASEQLKAFASLTDKVEKVSADQGDLSQRMAAVESRLTQVIWLLGVVITGLIGIAFNVIGIIPTP